MYHMISNPGTKGEMGLRLGLSIAFNMLKRSKGTLEITSEVNTGSSFTAIIQRQKPFKFLQAGNLEVIDHVIPRIQLINSLIL
ncbi:hypothetical protein A0256_00710 [Mucilaginibacter sp. PAMC 26640]|nr:hypothetical protein A0256_00710 [Mucilaginibacter sp. PAMC 26640]